GGARGGDARARSEDGAEIFARSSICYRIAVTTIAPTTTMGAVELTVADLERSLEYYRESIGLDVLESGTGQAALGAGEAELLRLVEEPGAAPANAYTGLFHFALLVPDRPSLARWLAHAVRE